MDNEIYLSDVSQRDKPWDKRRHQTEQVQTLYRGTEFDSYASRIQDCSTLLGFNWNSDLDTGEVSIKLQQAKFCRVRYCPVCQWRKSLMWRARFYNAVPKLLATYPSHRYLFLTLTVRNCPIDQLSSTIAQMNSAWKRLTQRSSFPADGWLKSVEVTRNQDDSDWRDTAHPHFHALLMVPSGYFVGRNYISQQSWRELWRDCLRLDYTPVVHVKAVKPKPDQDYAHALRAALTETLKYSVKPQDLVGVSAPTDADRAWLVALTQQMKGSRSVAVGGILRQFIADSEPDDLIHPEGADSDSSTQPELWFTWKTQVKRYAKT